MACHRPPDSYEEAYQTVCWTYRMIKADFGLTPSRPAHVQARKLLDQGVALRLVVVQTVRDEADRYLVALSPRSAFAICQLMEEKATARFELCRA